MAVDDLLFVNPLLGADDAWSGYLVETAQDIDAAQASASLSQHPALATFDQRHPWLIPASGSAAARENLIHVFPAQPTQARDELEALLRQKKCRLALTTAPNEKLPAPGTWDYVLISISQARTLPPYALLGLSSRTTILATDVHSLADYAWVHANACTLVSAEFLLACHQGNAKADMTRVKLLELLTLLAEDADTSEIEAIFRQEPKLSYSLLRLVNSAAMAPRTPITSFAQAINLLGRRQLQRWLQLLVYADPNNGHHPNPLLQKAAARGRLLEQLAAHLPAVPDIDNMQDAAFMVGAFSLLDVLLNIPMRDVLKQLPLATPVQAALGDHAGHLGKLLHAQEAAENRNFSQATRLLSETPITPGAYLDAQLAALSWAARIHAPA